jgi:hypothetical protein
MSTVSGQSEAVAVTQNRDPMTVASQIKKGAYFDSVTLMHVGNELAMLPGVAEAAVVRGTRSNQAILAANGFGLSPHTCQEEMISTPHHA